MAVRAASVLFSLAVACLAARAQNFPIAPYCGGEGSTVESLEGRGAPSKRVTSVDDFAKGLFLRTDVDRTDLLENELVQVKWVLYYPNSPKLNVDYQITDYRLPDLPDFIKEWNIIAKENDSTAFGSAVVNGMPYRSRTLLCFYMYPSKDGKVSVGEGRINIQLYGADGKEYGVPLSLRSKPVALSVHKLEKPVASFTGGIGGFKVETELLKADSVRVGETATLRIKVKGCGNFKYVNVPTPVFPDGVECYPAKPSNNVRYSCRECNGERVFDFLFIPHKAGSFSVPPLSFSYFDSRSRRFKELKTSAVKVSVLPAQSAKPFKKMPKPLQKVSASPYWCWIAVVVAAVVVLGMLLAVVWKRRKRRLAVNFELEAYDSLNEARENLQGDELFNRYVKILIAYIGNKLNYPVATQSKTVLADILRENGASEASVTLVLTVINECEKASYTPCYDVKEQHNIYKTAVFAITQLQQDFDSSVRCSTLS